MAVVKRLNVWRKFHGLDLTSAGNEVLKSLELSPRETETIHFRHQMSFSSLTYFSAAVKAKALYISMLLDLAVYYFLIVLAEAGHTCYAWLYNCLPEYEYSKKY